MAAASVRRALVVGDALRRLVGRTLAQAVAPHFGLSTRAGSEALPRVLRAAAKVDARATILCKCSLSIPG